MEFIDQEKVLLMDKTSGRQQARHPLKGIVQHI
jgi:hypothetical protein